VGNKLGIVIPLKSKIVSKDWGGVCQALQATIKSIEGQTSKQYECIVVGHERPDFFKTKVDQVDFQEVQGVEVSNYATWTPADRQKAITHDKNSKIFQGVLSLRQKAISHWFALDADDLIHREFVKTILGRNPRYGAIIERGYILNLREGLIFPNRRLHASCGSTSILADSVLPEELNAMCQLPWCRYSHIHIREYFEEELGVRCDILRERLVCYITNHGDNSSVDYKPSFAGRLKSLALRTIFRRTYTETSLAEFSQ
jgi:hypothetical protein